MQFFKILIFFISIFGPICINAQKIDRCALIDSILSVDKIIDHLQLEKKKAKFVRVYNPSRFFKGCNCIFKTHTVTFIDKLTLDFNSGKYIDLAITKIKKENNLLHVSIFYALSGQSDEYPNLWAGDIEVELFDDNFRITKSSLYNIQ